MSPRAIVVSNALIFQIVWLISVAGAARGLWYAGPIAVAAFATWQLTVSASARADMKLLLLAFGLGLIADSLLARAGLVSYASPIPSSHWAPLWILALWINFALTLNHSMAWLKAKPWLACLFGAIGGPLSYFFAARTWHAVTLIESVPLALGVIAVTWAIVTPLLCHVAQRISQSDIGAPIIETELLT